ncbi:aspartate kinase [Stieleria bergensis]|uniref:Aspartate kinase n=1 Tax=Stieleria bergensis TaxID=2528025 RepID=A0A517T0Z3_9BACT|nr:aspartate kinase [Planctomycetes bacterium SV_7m_r]
MHQRLEHLLYLGRSTAQIISWKLSRRFRTGRRSGGRLGKGTAAYQRQPLSLMGLEQRLLMSAVPLDVIEAGEAEELDGPLLIQGDAGLTEGDSPAVEDTAQAGAVLVFLDPSVTDFDAVLASLTANTPEADLYLLSDNSSGVAQITEVLSERSDVHSLHIVAGTEGVNSVFGSEDLDQVTLNQYVGSIAAWNDALYNAGEIHFYDTDFASSLEGQTFLQVMELLTGTTVTESSSSSLRTQVEASLVGSGAVVSWDLIQQDSIIVTTTSDVNDVGLGAFDRDDLAANRGADGEVSLREAIIAANHSAGIDRIAFDIGDAQPDEISLLAALPEITDSVVIDGHAANADLPMPGVSLQGNDLAIDGLVLGTGSDGSYLIGLSVMNLGGSGIVVESANNTIVGNWLGGLSLTTGLADSDLAIAADGLRIHSDGNTIGGRTDDEQNVLGVMDGNGIALIDASNNQIHGNRIGVAASQPTAAAIGQSGIQLSGNSDANQIGQRGSGNLVAFTGSNGITIEDESDSNLLRFNRIMAFSGLAIDLGNDGRNINDPLDADDGPNDLLNGVQLDSASIDTQGALAVNVSLQAQASADYNIDFYLSDSQGQLRRFLGQQALSTDGLGSYSGVANLTTNGLDGSNYLSAITTDDAGNSSEAVIPLQLIEDNLAPVLTVTPQSNLLFVEDGPALVLFPDVQITDDGELSGAVIETFFHALSDVRLQFEGTDSIVGTWDADARTFDLSGQASAAEYEAAIEQIELVNYTNRVGPEFGFLNLTVFDSFDQSVKASQLLAVEHVVNEVTGDVKLSGPVVVGEAATVDISGVTDPELATNIVVKWYLDGEFFLQADEFTPTNEQAGRDISASVHFVSIFSGSRSLWTDTEVILGSNQPAVGLPVIPHAAAEDQVLSVDLDAISDVDGMATSVFTYQWYRDGAAVVGATSDQYTLGDADVEAEVHVEVSFTDDRGGVNVLQSLATTAVANVDDAPVGLPAITGVATEDQTLGVDLGGISDIDGMATSVFTYQWYRDGATIVGATADQYTLGDADVDAEIHVEVSFADDRGGVNALQSLATTAVVNVDDAPVGLPVITGIATEDQTLGVELNGISDVDGMATSVFTYQWYRDGAVVVGATSDQYTLGDADVEAEIHVEVSFADDRGGVNVLQSLATTAVVNVDDAPVGLPLITGVATEDQTLGVDLNGVSDVDGMATSVFTYQWYRDGAVIVGATADQYTLGDADVDAEIHVEVSFADDRGGVNVLQSLATTAVANVDDAPVGLPVITGIATEDQTLGVDLGGISDVDGMATSVFTYQWYRDGAAVVGATADQYTLGDADVDAGIHVEVSFTDDRGGVNVLQSVATTAVVNVDDAPVGLPLITGVATEDQTLGVDLNGISDIDGMTTSVFTYQWYRDGAAVVGATSDQYTLGDADVEAEIHVEVSFTDDRGGVNVLQSLATTAVVNVDDAPLGLPLITGVATEDQTLGVELNGISDVDGMATSVFTYQWYRDGATIVGATADQYTLGDADVEAEIHVEVSFADDRGGVNVLQSVATTAVVNVDDAPIGLPVITGIATEDQTLDVDLNGVSDVDGMTTSVFSYQWYRDGAVIVGATADQYTLGDADVDAEIHVDVSFTDDRGGVNALQSLATTAVVNVDDAPVGLPLITGVVTEDQTLGVDLGGISDVDGMATSVFSYQWYRDGAVIVGATADQYTLGDADVEAEIHVEVSFTDDRGGVNALQSLATTAVVNVDDAPVGLPVITGIATEDQTLGVDLGGISDVDGMTTSVFTYQWYRDGATIVGATADQYTLGDADVDAEIHVEVSFTDDRGGVNVLQSLATTAVVNVDDAPIGLPAIAGVSTEDQTLGVDLNGISDVDGMATSVFSYQWYRDGAAVVGATADQYTLGDADVDAEIHVEVSFTDDRGGVNVLQSVATTAVVNVDDAPIGLPVIIGTAIEDRALSVDLSDLSDMDGLATSLFSYQWFRDGSVIVDATSDQFTLGDADVGNQIHVEVGFSDDQGTSYVLTSERSPVVQNVDDAPTGLPMIVGLAIEDQVLHVDTGLIQDADGIEHAVFGYQWYRDGVLVFGETSDAYTLGDEDVDSVITVEVEYTDDRGTVANLMSVATDVVANVDDDAVGLPLINGVAIEDQWLGVDTSQITDADGLSNVSFSYQWYRDQVAISGGTTDQLLLSDIDVDAQISVSVTFTDDRGMEYTRTSVLTGPVKNLDDSVTGQPVIVGQAVEDQQLSLDLAGIADADGMENAVFSYQWYRDGLVIDGATEATYTPTDADFGKNITVLVSFVDDRGGSSVTLSQPTDPVQGVNDDPTGVPVMVGTFLEEEVLYADLSGLVDPDGLPSAYQYQWFKDGVAISGADQQAYALTIDDVAQRVSVQVEYVDLQGTREVLRSAESPLIDNINDPPELQDLGFEIRFGESLDAAAEFFQQQAFDIDGDELEAIVVSTPSSGTLEVQPDGSFVFTPRTGFFGEVSFSWVAFDGEFISDAATVTIVIAPPIDTTLPPDEGGGTGTSQPGSSGGPGTADANDEGLSQSDLDQLKGHGASKLDDSSLVGEQAIEESGDEQFESSLLVFAYASDSIRQGANGHEIDVRVHSLKPLLTEQSHNQSSVSLYTEVAESVADSIDWAHYNFAEVNRHIWEQLNYSESHLSTILRNRQILAGSFGAATGGIAFAIVSWLRNSVLLLGVLQQRPIWSSMDPLLLIQGLRDQDTESLEDVFKDQKEKLYGSGESVV